MKNQALLSEALALHQNGHLKQAIERYQKILKSEPSHFDAHNLLGAALLQKAELSKAIEHLRNAVKLRSDSAPAHYNLGRALAEKKDFTSARARFKTAVELQATWVDAWVNLGHCERELGQLDAHLQAHQKALSLQPNDPELLYNVGNAWKVLGHKEKAIHFYGMALAVKPDYAEALYNRGVIEQEQGLAKEAVKHFKKALELNWEYSEAWAGLGNSLLTQKKQKDALESFEQALRIKSDLTSALFGKGEALCQLKRFEEGLPFQKRAIDSNLLTPHWLGTYVQNRMQACDWQGLQNYNDTLLEKCLQHPHIVSTWTLCSVSENRSLFHQHARVNYLQSKPKSDEALPPIPMVRKEKIRLGYFSSDFHNHPVGYLIGELIDLHDRNRFEVIGYYLGTVKNDPVKDSLKKSFDQFHEVSSMGYKELATFARTHELDVAIDLNGHTGDAKIQTFYLRVAPVQINFLGYPGTTGSDEHDYIIADDTVIPTTHENDYSEKVIRMPHSFFVNNTKRIVSQRPLSRDMFGLPSEAFVFCSMNNAYKINETTFNSWLSILKAVPDSVLWLGESNQAMKDNLWRYAKLRDVPNSRIIFAQRLPDMSEHLARHQLADLFLDTTPYNAHTTAADALWSGLPVLTLEGQSFASRVASSQLKAIGLDELITHTREHYEKKAINIALTAGESPRLKNLLRLNLKTAPLFDTKRYVQALEDRLIACLSV